MPADKDDGREYNRVHISSNSAPNCYIGPLHDNDQLSDTEISEYIKANKPELFKRLHGLPINSSNFPMSFNSSRSVTHSTKKDLRNTRPPFQTKDNGQTLRNRYIESESPVSFASTSSFLRLAKTRIEQKLRNGYSLYRHRYNIREGLPACDLRLCVSQANNPATGEMLVVEYDLAKNTEYALQYPVRNEYFCTPCFQCIFSVDKSRQSEMAKETSKALYFDGVGHGAVDHHTVVNSAKRLYTPTVLPTSFQSNVITDSKGYEDHAFNYPSNSPKAKLIRAHVQQEIEQTLIEVARYEKARENELKNRATAVKDDVQEVNLLITRPYYIEPKGQRYRKQGLTENDYKKDLKLRKELIDRRVGLESSITAPPLSPLKTIFKEDRICSCREPDDGTEILRCSAEFCPIGWFHLHCTNLERMPTIREAYYCEYCRHSSDESGIEPLDVTNSRHSSIDPDTYSPIRSAFLRTSQDIHPNRTLADWTAVNRAQYELENSLKRSIQCTPEKSIDSLDNGYLASDEFESAEELDSRQSNSEKATPISISFHRVDSYSTPTTHHDRCTTPKPNRPTDPQTPPAASNSVYVSSKPWGTPVNINTPSMRRSFDISSPASPSPTKKRKLDQIENDMRGISLEISDSQDSEDEEGELVPLILER